MARRKTTPELVREKCSLAERLRAIRAELFGERGGPELARRLGIPVRTWYNYEAGVTVPAEVVLRVIQLTSLEPAWLLTGKGPKFRLSASEGTPFRTRGRPVGPGIASDRSATTGERCGIPPDGRRFSLAPDRRSRGEEGRPGGR